MAIQAAEISAILKDQIKNFGKEAEVSEVGQVLSVGDGIARVYGLDNVQAGEMVEVTLRWWLAEPVERDYSVFVHLREPGSGQIIAQGDGPPVAGWYPTSLWQAGDVVDDAHGVPAPAVNETTGYDLVVGWYDLASGERLAGFMTDAIQMTSMGSAEARLELQAVPVQEMIDQGLV